MLLGNTARVSLAACPAIITEKDEGGITMDELIAMISEKLGVTPDKASMAVNLVVNHIKGQAPALSGQLDGLLGGGGGAAGLGDAASKLGGLMGGQK